MGEYMQRMSYIFCDLDIKSEIRAFPSTLPFGLMSFVQSGLFFTSVRVQGEFGCSDPSHGRSLESWADGKAH
jgi:hypothetical protein